MPTLDFRDFLRQNLDEKIEKNKSYSLRSYSKKLGIAPGMLSKLMRKQIPLTDKILNKLIPVFEELSADEIKQYRASAKTLKKHLKQIKISTLDQSYLDSISEWHTIAVLEIVGLQPTWSIEQISDRLKISKKEAENDIQILLAAQLIKENIKGQYVQTNTHRSTLPIGKIKKSLSKRQTQVLEKSIDSILHDDPQLRDHASITIAIDPALLPMAAQKMREYRRELATWLDQNSENKTQIYEITTGIFPLTKDEF